MRKIIRDLYLDLEHFNKENVAFHTHYKNITGNGWTQWGDYHYWINHNICTLDSIAVLVREKRYRDCYILLRPVLEAYLIIKLCMLGNRYFYDLLPLDEKGRKESAADLLKRANQDPNLLNNPHFISKKLVRRRKKYWVRLLFNSPPVEKTTVYVPNHYLLAKEYEPDTVYLSDLIIRNRWDDEKSKQIKEVKKRNKNIKENFFDMDCLQDFFKVNKFKTTRSMAIFTHYSFLSKFIHPTVNGYQTISKGNTKGHINNINEVNDYDFLNELLILLYSLFLSIYFVELQLEYFSQQSDLEVDKEYKRVIVEKIKNINEKYSFFWFLYNKPHKFDEVYYKNKRSNMRLKRKFKIPYFVNPLNRLKDLTSFWPDPHGGLYSPPKILSEEL